jgi:hypothetical protein
MADANKESNEDVSDAEAKKASNEGVSDGRCKEGSKDSGNGQKRGAKVSGL